MKIISTSEKTGRLAFGAGVGAGDDCRADTGVRDQNGSEQDKGDAGRRQERAVEA